MSLLILRKDNFIRKPLIRLVTWRVFDGAMLAIILANCVTLAMQSNQPGFGDTTTGQTLLYSDYTFIGLFIFEALCKIMALGFVFGEHTYLRNGGWGGECPHGVAWRGMGWHGMAWGSLAWKSHMIDDGSIGGHG